jgi:hypothetical protein
LGLLFIRPLASLAIIPHFVREADSMSAWWFHCRKLRRR